MIRHGATSATMPLCRPRRWSQREGRTKKPAGVLDESSGLTRKRVETDEAGLDHPGRFMRECVKTGQEL
jgi:hypothetical protein